MKQSILLKQLINKSQQYQERAEEILDLPLETLTKRPRPEAWNTLEVIEHLNYYIDIYNEFISDALSKTKPSSADSELKRGYFGNKFISMMEPTGEKIKKMNTFKSKNPIGKPLSKQCIQHFLDCNKKLISLLENSKERDITTVKSKLAIPVLKIKLHDAMSFLVAHNERHFMQIENVLKS